MLAFINFPSWIKPEIIPGFPIRWYSLMYLIAFGIAWFLMQKQIKDEKPNLKEDDIVNYFFWGILGLLIGARIFATTIYDPEHYYITHPWMIFVPFRNGQFTGLQGMSYHGGVFGAIVGTLIFCRIKKISWFKMADFTAPGIPLGYTFGRLGNFINGELWGRVTTKSWGIVFPHAGRFSVKLDWVQRVAAEVGMKLPESGLVNLPRHPSQLYEAAFEGIILWLVLWFVLKNRKKFDGAMLSFYLIGYGIVRFFIEYFREPDSDMGFPLNFGAAPEDPALFNSFLNFTTGQILCLFMILTGVILYHVRKKQVLKEAENTEAPVKSESLRKKRKKIK